MNNKECLNVQKKLNEALLKNLLDEFSDFQFDSPKAISVSLELKNDDLKLNEFFKHIKYFYDISYEHKYQKYLDDKEITIDYSDKQKIKIETKMVKIIVDFSGTISKDDRNFSLEYVLRSLNFAEVEFDHIVKENCDWAWWVPTRRIDY